MLALHPSPCDTRTWRPPLAMRLCIDARSKREAFAKLADAVSDPEEWTSERCDPEQGVNGADRWWFICPNY